MNRLAQKGNVTGDRLSDVRPVVRPTSSPAESAALTLRKTNVRNVGTTSVLSMWSIME